MLVTHQAKSRPAMHMALRARLRPSSPRPLSTQAWRHMLSGQDDTQDPQGSLKLTAALASTPHIRDTTPRPPRPHTHHTTSQPNIRHQHQIARLEEHGVGLVQQDAALARGGRHAGVAGRGGRHLRQPAPQLVARLLQVELEHVGVGHVGVGAHRVQRRLQAAHCVLDLGDLAGWWLKPGCGLVCAYADVVGSAEDDVGVSTWDAMTSLWPYMTAGASGAVEVY
mmetsp:Transcript_24736/g.62802  ORF Transcript_24736/g.62802 Transcript_24736/m.62802 type:complete len:224 (+) Transcript_24736:490-1161(+)